MGKNRVNALVNDAAKGILVRYKQVHGYKNLDEALEALLMDFNAQEKRIKELERGDEVSE